MTKERRSHPRKSAQLDGHIGPEKPGKTLQIRTCDISCSGVSCDVPCYIAPFTQLRVAMSIPIYEEDRVSKERLQLDGTVVRTDPEQKLPERDSYRVAIFFSDMSERQREIISQ